MARLITLSLALVFTVSCSFSEESEEFGTAMHTIAFEYATIHKAFSADSTTGVDEAAHRIEEVARTIDVSTIEGEKAGLLEALPARLAGSAAKLVQARDLAGKREVFRELSASMVEWAVATRPVGLHIASCPMAKARWLQREDKVLNPYYGSSMLHCGTIGSPPTR